MATNLSRAIQLLGHTVLLADSDPQGSARDWAAANEAQPVPVAGPIAPRLIAISRASRAMSITL